MQLERIPNSVSLVYILNIDFYVVLIHHIALPASLPFLETQLWAS